MTDQGQAAILASARVLREWGANDPGGGRFAKLPASIALGPVERGGLTAFAISDRMWRDGFGHWSGVGVDALISHGFLKHWAWTMDFDRRVFTFHAPSS